MEQNEITATPSINNMPNNKPKIAIIVLSIIAICGIVVGVFQFLDNNRKSQRIIELQNQVTELQGQIDQLALPNSEVDQNTKIKIISSSWSGWSEDYTPTEEETYCNIQLNKKCIVKTEHFSNAQGDEWEEEILSLEVTNITDSYVTIHTFQKFSDNESGIDLKSDKQIFTIEVGKSIKLTTPTMDYGDSFVLSLVTDK
jgi:hypothetical protein